MEGIVLWILLIVTGGAPSGGMFPTVQECREALERLSKDPEIAAISECTEVRMRIIGPKT